MAAYVNILMADDDMEDRMIVKQSFKEIYPSDEVDFAEDGMELLSLLDKSRTEKKLPAVILLDLNMPRLNGLETLRKLKDMPEYDRIPVVIFSTAVNDVQRDECLLLGAQHYITKPTTYDEATNIIHFIHNLPSRPRHKRLFFAKDDSPYLRGEYRRRVSYFSASKIQA